MPEHLHPTEILLTAEKHVAAAWNTLFRFYKEQGDLPHVLECLRHAAALDPQNVLYQAVLGEYMRISGDVPGAIRLLRQAAAMPTDDKQAAVVALINLGTALQEGNRPDEAIESYRKAARLAPNVPQVVNNLLALYVGRRDFKNAGRYLTKALKLDGNDPSILSNAALLYRSRGELAKCGETYRRCLRILMEGYPRLFIVPRKKPMETVPADKALLATRDLLEQANVQFFLAFGTLLGLVRDRKLLPYDKDTDLGLPWNVPRAQLRDFLERNGYWYDHSAGELRDDSPVYNFAVVHKATGITIDFFFFKEEGDTLTTGIDSLPEPVLQRFPLFKLQEAQWQGKSWLIPSPPEKFLEDIYGADWRTPDPYFDTVISGRVRTHESDDLVYLMAYGKIVDEIKRCQWKKCLGLVRQMQVIDCAMRAEDTFLAQLEAWLQARAREQES